MSLPAPRGRQRDVLSMRTNGHIVVLGTAGSGKTTVAALRAQILADPRTPHTGKTLLVTYNKSLVTYLRSIAASELECVTVETFHRFAFGYLRSRGLMRKIVRPSERARLVLSAMSESGLANILRGKGIQSSSLKELLSNEFSIIARAALSREMYLASDQYRNRILVDAVGAGNIYDALEAYRKLRDESIERYDFDDSLTAAWEAICNDGEHRLYKHIVIDEGQDFAPVMLKTLIAAIQPGGSVSFFGDVAQQIYGRETNWREAEFQVSKAEIFEENFRNTAEVIRLGSAIARMPYYRSVQDLIDPKSNADAGPPPTLVRFESVDVEVKWICQQAINAVDTQNVAIICPAKHLAKKVSERFSKLREKRALLLDRGLARWYPESKPRIYVSTYHNAKGLEFGSVILAFTSSAEMPGSALERIYGEEEAATRAGTQFYVGVTRSRRNLLITYSGAVSALIPVNDQRPPLYTTLKP